MEPVLSCRRDTLLFIGACLLVLCVSIAFIPPNISKWHHGGDFGHYYTSAVRLADGENPYQGTLEEKLRAYGFPLERIEYRATNPPALILFTLPFTILSPQRSFWVWNIFQISLFLLTALLFWRRVGDGMNLPLYYGLLLLFCSVPLFMHIRLGQTQLLLAACVMASAALIKEKPRTSYFILGFAASLKLFLLPLALVSLRDAFSRRKEIHPLKTLPLYAVGLLLLPFIAEMLSPTPLHAPYFKEIVPIIETLQLQITRGTSLSFFIFYLVWGLYFDFNAPANLPELIGGKIRLALFILLGLLLLLEHFFQRGSYNPVRSLLAITCFSLLCSPVVWPHYFVLLFPVLLFLWTQKRQAPSWKNQALLALSFCAALTPGFSTALPTLTALWGPSILVIAIIFLFTPNLPLQRFLRRDGSDLP